MGNPSTVEEGDDMSVKAISIYLAGAIRDGHPEDIEWREDVIRRLAALPVRILNPLAGKHYDEVSKTWTVSGVPSTAKLITRHDKWYLEHSDAVVFNFRALSQGYPNIGTLVEFGMAVARGALIYVIVDADYTGHENVKMYHLHPFLNEFASVVFHDVDACVAFLRRHVTAISGASPSYVGTAIETPG